MTKALASFEDAERIAARRRARLTAPQWDLLGRICATNGGGISASNEDSRTWEALRNRGLIQGKAGQEWKMVHTAEGLQAWRG